MQSTLSLDILGSDICPIAKSCMERKMSDPTKVKTLSEEFPLCKAMGLLLEFKTEFGPHIQAQAVETLLDEVIKHWPLSNINELWSLIKDRQ